MHHGENFDEAVAARSEVAKTQEPSEAVLNILNDEKAQKDGESEFWVFVAALKEFYEEFKRLPVAGVLPDMISKSEFYI